MAQYFEMDDPFRTITRPATGPTPLPTLDTQVPPSYDAEVRQRLAAMRAPATAPGGAGAVPPAPPTSTVSPAGAPATPETAARKPPGKLAKAGGVLALGGAIANQMTGGNGLATAGMTAMGAAPFSGPLAPVLGGTGALLTAAGAVQEATGMPTISSDGARRFDSQIMAPLRRMFNGPEVRGAALTQPTEVPVTETIIQKDVPAAPVAAPVAAPGGVADPLAAPTIGAYRNPENYAPILAAVGGRIPGGAAAARTPVPTMGGNAFGIDPNAVRTNTVQAVKAEDGSTVYTNFAAPGTPEAANAAAAPPPQYLPANGESYGGVQERGVQGAVDSILGLGAIRTARADEMAKAKLQNDYRTAVATQMLKNQATTADRNKDIKVTLPGFAEGVYSRRDQTVTTFGADGTATVKPVQSAPPPLSEGSIRAINRQMMAENPSSSLRQRREKLEEYYGKGKIEDAWLR